MTNVAQNQILTLDGRGTGRSKGDYITEYVSWGKAEEKRTIFGAKNRKVLIEKMKKSFNAEIEGITHLVCRDKGSRATAESIAKEFGLIIIMDRGNAKFWNK